MDIVEFAEKYTGHSLTEYQKQLLRDMCDPNVKPEMIMCKNNGRSEMQLLGKIAGHLYGSAPDAYMDGKPLYLVCSRRNGKTMLQLEIYKKLFEDLAR